MFHINDSATLWNIPVEERTDHLDGRPLLIVMHGFGATEKDLYPIATLLPQNIVLAALRAPFDAGNGGYAWFRMGEVPAAPPPEDVDSSTAAVIEWLDALEQRVGPISRVGALGFSQGGAMSLQLMREAPERFAAAVNLSGFIPTPEHPGDSVLSATKPPVFWGRDPQDPVIPGYAVERTHHWLDSHARTVAREYPKILHGISAEEMVDVSGFLRQHLAPSSS